jgi:mannitol/fructose-specific phosphotransferase system IIA component (Ntr-type)
MEGNKDEIRFGMVAVEKGFVTPEQVVEALEIQVKENLSTGMHRCIGVILQSKGFITPSQLDEALKALEELKLK